MIIYSQLVPSRQLFTRNSNIYHAIEVSVVLHECESYTRLSTLVRQKEPCRGTRIAEARESVYLSLLYER